ncbi:MAG: hypothetical protein IKG18_12990 [Atopobiaceae bacterium]|nr:hypothetical protein [Atopobiaceae bacterium]
MRQLRIALAVVFSVLMGMGAAPLQAFEGVPEGGVERETAEEEQLVELDTPEIPLTAEEVNALGSGDVDEAETLEEQAAVEAVEEEDLSAATLSETPLLEGVGGAVESTEAVEPAPLEDAASDESTGLEAQATSPSDTAKNSTKRVGKPTLRYGVHCQTYGDRAEVKGGAIAGTTGESKRLEALWIRVGGIPHTSGGITYRTHVQGTGWETSWAANGQRAGTSGQSKRVEAVQIKLTGKIAKKYDVWYRVHTQRYGWLGWTKNGKKAGTEGCSLRMEAIQIKLVSKGGVAPGKTTSPFKKNQRARMVIIGDSRSLETYATLYGERVWDAVAVVREDTAGNWWIGRYGGGYNWFANTGASCADEHVGRDTAVVILLGVNDLLNEWGRKDPVLGSSDAAHYARLINRKAKQWRGCGAVVYYATVTPVGSRPGDDVFVSSSGKRVTNARVRKWNDKMRSLLSSNVTVLDTYSAIAKNYRASDSMHYDAATYRRLFEYVRSHVAS